MEKKTKNKLKYIIIILIVVVLIGIVFFIVWNDRKNDKTQELTSFDITVISYLDLMPTGSKNDNSQEAYFKFTLVGIEKDEFIDEYEIESINLNGSTINNEDIIYDHDDYGFRFYSSNYKNNNVINLIMKNKKTNIEYSKRLKVSTETVQ